MQKILKELSIPGYPGYTVLGFDVIGSRGRYLRAGTRDVMTIYRKGKALKATRAKLVWCARNRCSPDEVPKKYSFSIRNGELIVEDLSQRMSRVRSEYSKMIRIQYDDYDFVERFANSAKNAILGDSEAQHRLFTLLQSRRKDLIMYAKTAVGGRGTVKATDYADRSILWAYEKTLSRTRALPSPVASMKAYIRSLAYEDRKKRELKVNMIS